MPSPTAILQVICPDRPALVSELSGWVSANGGNIRHADHHTDLGAGLFLSRIEWSLEGFGLPREAALRAITLSPAEIFGVSDALGSIEVGKAATLILTNGDILDHRTNITNVIIDGRETSLDNKHQRLYDRYKAR